MHGAKITAGYSYCFGSCVAIIHSWKELFLLCNHNYASSREYHDLEI